MSLNVFLVGKRRDIIMKRERERKNERELRENGSCDGISRKGNGT